MKNRSVLISDAGLHFFGRMSASVSHELKNVLAIIKESAGLLNDYTAMMGKNITIDPERFETVAARIDKQTRRADAIVKSLNTFAHTVDTQCKSVDLNETLALLVALSHRPAAMQQVTLEIQPSDSVTRVNTAPFVLLNALGLCLVSALKAVPPGGTMTLAVMKPGAGFCFGQLKNWADFPAQEFPSEPENALLTALGAKWRMEPAAGQLLIELPRSCEKLLTESDAD